MALFSLPSADLLFPLLHLGFTARLRSETADIYLQHTDGTLTTTTNRPSATLFQFLSGDTLPPILETSSTKKVVKPWPERSLLCALIANQSTSLIDSDPLYLTVRPQPTLTDTPALIRIAAPWGGDNPHRVLISLRDAVSPTHLSIADAPPGSPLKAVSRENYQVTKYELFHIEIVPGTIANPLVPIPSAVRDSPEYVSLAQAATHAILQLGIRFRIRSSHGRILHRDTSSSGSEPTVIVVLQDQDTSSISETSDRDIIFSAFKPTGSRDDAEITNYVCKEVNTDKVLSVAQDNAQISLRNTLYDTVALLMPHKTAKHRLGIHISPNAWGQIALCKLPAASASNDDPIEWLMAGPRGRLETRNHRQYWEYFTLEFVQQSYNAAVHDISVPTLYHEANENTRANARAEIAANVAAAREVDDATRKPDFNHAAALGGLSEKTSKVTRATEKKTGGSKATKKKKPQTSDASSTANVPRNQANRRLSRKKKKGKRSSKESKRVPDVPPPKAPDAAVSRDVAKPNISESGPPCAACGHAVSGTYTKALGKDFHTKCFCCGICRKPLGTSQEQFRERSGTPYCQSCFAANLASRCARCSKPIMDTVTTAMDKTWHKDCLTCTICRLPLTQQFWLYADKPNEPRCSRCVTGSEEVVGYGRGHRGRGSTAPLLGATNLHSSHFGQGSSGRARLIPPVLPVSSQR